MAFNIDILFNDNLSRSVSLERPELLYGATHILSSAPELSGKTGLNPLTKKLMPVIKTSEETTRFFIPAHIQADYEYALQHNLPLAQVIAPYFSGTGEEALKPNLAVQDRHSIIAVIKNNSDDSYLCEDARGRACQCFVLGGIEDGETPEQAAIREIYEETGYKNVQIDKVSNFRIINHFYAGYKGVNRFAYLNIVFGHLLDDTRDRLTAEEDAKHEVIWIAKHELADFINLANNRYALEMLLNGESAWTGNGIMLTDDENNRRNNLEVREDIIKRFCAK